LRGVATVDDHLTIGSDVLWKWGDFPGGYFRRTRQCPVRLEAAREPRRPHASCRK
jgi:hypothetical protein